MDDNLKDDWREFLSLMISKRVKFLVLGGHAVSIHAPPRVTEDLDVFVEVSRRNATRLERGHAGDLFARRTLGQPMLSRIYAALFILACNSLACA